MTTDRDAPMTLERACRDIFAGEITPATLRAEARRGRLVIERIGRKDFVTLNAIDEMRRLCRLPVSDARQSPRGASTLRTGSSLTEAGISPQDALLHKVRKLLASSKSTSQATRK